MDEEQVLFKGSPSLLVNAGSIFVTTLVMAAGVAMGIMVNPWFYILAGLALVYEFIQILLVKSRVYEVTTQRIRFTRGLITKRTDELELYRVKDATLVEPLSQRMLGLGTIEIETVDVSTPNCTLEAIKGARSLRENLRQSIETCRDKKRVRLTELE